jgi:hypothetical protein
MLVGMQRRLGIERLGIYASLPNVGFFVPVSRKSKQAAYVF